MISKKHTPIETWIWENLKPEESDSAHQTYNNMVQQGGGKLAVIDDPQNLRDPSHFADEARIQEIVLHFKEARDVLDVGTGDGWPTLRIAPHFRMVTGIDAALRRVEMSRANAEKLKIVNVKFQQMSATEISFGDNIFDAAVAMDSIEQTDNPLQALSHIFRVLRPGGRFYVQFEDIARQLTRPTAETVRLEDHADGTLGWHYCLKHKDPPWERDYLVTFDRRPEVEASFFQARETIGRVGNNPVEIPEIGLQFLEANKALVKMSSYYELEHFSARAMIESLEDVGFVEVRSLYSAQKLAAAVFPELEAGEMSDKQLLGLGKGLAAASLELPAPDDQGQPVVAVKPG